MGSAETWTDGGMQSAGGCQDKTLSSDWHSAILLLLVTQKHEQSTSGETIKIWTLNALWPLEVSIFRTGLDLKKLHNHLLKQCLMFAVLIYPGKREAAANGSRASC